jgi:hypothetical protein
MRPSLRDEETAASCLRYKSRSKLPHSKGRRPSGTKRQAGRLGNRRRNDPRLGQGEPSPTPRPQQSAQPTPSRQPCDQPALRSQPETPTPSRMAHHHHPCEDALNVDRVVIACSRVAPSDDPVGLAPHHPVNQNRAAAAVRCHDVTHSDGAIAHSLQNHRVAASKKRRHARAVQAQLDVEPVVEELT